MAILDMLRAKHIVSYSNADDDDDDDDDGGHQVHRPILQRQFEQSQGSKEQLRACQGADGVGFIFSTRLPCPKNIQKSLGLGALARPLDLPESQRRSEISPV